MVPITALSLIVGHQEAALIYSKKSQCFEKKLRVISYEWQQKRTLAVQVNGRWGLTHTRSCLCPRLCLGGKSVHSSG